MEKLGSLRRIIYCFLLLPMAALADYIQIEVVGYTPYYYCLDQGDCEPNLDEFFRHIRWDGKSWDTEDYFFSTDTNFYDARQYFIEWPASSLTPGTVLNSDVYRYHVPTAGKSTIGTLRFRGQSGTMPTDGWEPDAPTGTCNDYAGQQTLYYVGVPNTWEWPGTITLEPEPDLLCDLSATKFEFTGNGMNVYYSYNGEPGTQLADNPSPPTYTDPPEDFVCADGTSACDYVDASGNTAPISPDSPDHPVNGGNADGDTTNDVYDDDGTGAIAGGGYATAGSGAYNQTSPNAGDAVNTQNQIASDQQLQAQNQQFLQNTFIEELSVDDFQGTVAQNVTAIETDMSLTEGVYDEAISGLSDVESGSGLFTHQNLLDDSGAGVNSLFGFSGGCADMNIVFSEHMIYSLKCDEFAMFRRGIEIFFGGLLVIYAFTTLTASMKELK